MPGQKVSAMRRLMIALLVAATVAFTLPSALAQDQINLGKETTGTLAFVAEGGGNFTLNLCDNLNGSRKCVVRGYGGRDGYRHGGLSGLQRGLYPVQVALPRREPLPVAWGRHALGPFQAAG